MKACAGCWFALIGLFGLFGPACARATTAGDAALPILIVHSYNQHYPWTEGQQQGFVDTLRQAVAGVLDIHQETLDSKRRTYSSDYAGRFGDYLAYKYQGWRPRLIYVTDDNALLFARERLRDLFPGVPILFSGVNDFSVLSWIGDSGVTGVLEKKDLDANLRLLRQLDPRARELLLVGDGSGTYDSIRREAQKDLLRYPGFNAAFVGERRIDRLLDQLSKRREKYLFLTTLGGVADAEGRLLPVSQVIERLVATEKFVIFNMEDAYQFEGVLGGYVTSAREQGAAAARQALALLDGRPIQAIPPLQDSPGVYMFDSGQLQRAGFELPDALARQALLLNQPTPFWQRHQTALVAALFVFALGFFLMIVSAFWYQSRKRRQIQVHVDLIKQQADALRDSEQSYRGLFNSINEAIYLLDEDGVFLDVNQGAERMYGMRRDELVGKGPASVSAAEGNDLDKVARQLRLAWQGKPQRFTFWGRRANGEEFPKDVSLTRGNYFGRPVVIAVAVDESERHAASLALQASEAKYRELVDNAAAIILRLNGAGEITYFNEYAEHFFGFSRQEILGRHVLGTIVPPTESESQRDLSRMIDEMLAEPERFEDNENENITKDGRRVYVHWTNRQIFDHAGQPDGLLCIGRDISAQKQAETALREAKLVAEQANRAKSAFLATMSHEIRTPLNGVLGMAQLLMEDEVSERERRDWASTIYSSGQGLLNLLNDILDLSKVEAGRIELERIPLDPLQVAQDALALFEQQAAQKGLQLVADYSSATASRVLGDPFRLRQMLSNLLNNAIKFTERGAVTLALRRLSGAPARWRFEVRDTGIGIAEDQLGRLFQVFGQLDGSITRRFGGTGLGLAITRSLVELMGGRIGVESRYGEGACFWLEVPFEEAAEPEPESRSPDCSRSASASLAPHAHGRILVAEDVRTNQQIIRVMLERLGYRVDLVENGQLALQRVRAGEQYELVLMDCQMPVMDGFEATRKIRDWEGASGAARLPVVALTAGAYNEDREHCLDSGMDDFLTKPIDRQVLLAALRRWCRSRAGA